MKKIKKVFLGVSALWSTMIAKVYATIEPRIISPMQEILYGPPEQDLYGIPRIDENNVKPLPLIAIIAIIVGLNVILRKKFKEKKNLLNIVLIISSVLVTVLVIFLIVSIFN